MPIPRNAPGLPPGLLDSAAAATLLGVSREAVRMAVWLGRLKPAYCANAGWLFRRSDVERYDASRKKRPRKSKPKNE